MGRIPIPKDSAPAGGEEALRLRGESGQLRNGAQKLKEESVRVREIPGKHAEGERQGTLRALVRARTHWWKALREVCV